MTSVTTRPEQIKFKHNTYIIHISNTIFSPVFEHKPIEKKLHFKKKIYILFYFTLFNEEKFY